MKQQCQNCKAVNHRSIFNGDRLCPDCRRMEEKFPMDNRVLLPCVQHSGSVYVANVIQQGKPSIMRPDREIVWKGTGVLHCHPDDARFEQILNYSRAMKTVIPIRHPALIAVSWKKRGPKNWRTDNFLIQWERIHEIEGFHFCIEEKPFFELEKYLRAKVTRTTKVMHSIGDYHEKKDFVTAKDFLGKDWALVEKALDMPLGRKFYDSNLCGLRSP